jgi:2-amino-4-hydroxy-6-hydroxymethyldihydropteridine diphosphokinase
VPHPQLPNRRFALEPMNEIAPKLVHPVLNKTIEQLLKECKDELPVEKLAVD